MKVEPTDIPGAWLIEPIIRPDSRGVFLECYTSSAIVTATGRYLDVQQANMSISGAGTVRGIHFASVPPGQAKYVMCTSGQVLDIVVDVRRGSPTFGQWDSAVLDSESRRALFVSEGLGHSFCALSGEATIVYFCSQPFAPTREFGIHPLDPALQLPWPQHLEILLSDKDASAPTLAEAETMGILPEFATCEHWYKSIHVG